MPHHAIEQEGPYIPQTDWGLVSWLQNFAQKVQENPARFNFSQADAEIIAGHYRDLKEAFDLAQNPDTRTASTVARKDSVRASAVASMRQFAGLIRANMGIDNSDKLALGLNLPNHSRSPLSAPVTAPLIAVTCAFPGSHEMRYADQTTPASRRKPRGVRQLWIYKAVTDRNEPVVTNPEGPEVHVVGAFTKQPLHIEHAPHEDGLVATYFGRWATATGLMGPWSLPARMTIAFGGGATLENLPTDWWPRRPTNRVDEKGIARAA